MSKLQTIGLGIILSLGSFSNLGFAADIKDAAALAKKNSCMACHAADKKMVGPSYTEIAKKYQKNPQAQKLIAKAIKNGSKGAWGPMPMPAHAGIQDADLQLLAKWIAAGAP